jgi:tRNA(fMet)-specific endonuclease VapC
MYYLDTNTCIYFLKGKFPSILEELKRKSPKEVKIASLVAAELLYGVEKSARNKENAIIYREFLRPFEIVPFDDRSAIEYAKLRFVLEKKGRSIGPNDLIIAATVLARKGTLVTHNIKEFKQVPGLALEDWVRE